MLPDRPVLNYGDVYFHYPAYQIATRTITFRPPTFGNTQSLSEQRIIRNGEVFTDDQWPENEVLKVSFKNLSQTLRDDFLDFMTFTLGQEIEFTDYEGRTWVGLITNPNSAMTDEVAVCGYAIDFEFTITAGERDVLNQTSSRLWAAFNITVTTTPTLLADLITTAGKTLPDGVILQTYLKPASDIRYQKIGEVTYDTLVAPGDKFFFHTTVLTTLELSVPSSTVVCWVELYIQD